MKPVLKVLVIEDDHNDALLLEIALSRAGYAPRCHRIESREAMETALAEGGWDFIISDYLLPNFNGLEALALVRDRGWDVPFVIVSGHITDDTAVAAMKAGAHDYVMKDNLSRLGPVVERELHEAELRRTQRLSEEKTRAEHAITLILAHAGSFAEAAPPVLDTLLRVLGANFGTLWVPGADGESLVPLVLQASQATPGSGGFLEATRGLGFRLGVGLPGRVWDEARPEWIADLAADHPCPRARAAALAGFASGLAFPIREGATFFGVIEFFSVRRLAYEPTWTSMIGAVCSEMGQFIQRRNAEAALRRTHAELEVRVRERTAELEAANAKLQASITERRRLEHELLEITEKERRRIGLDLHDDLGQKLTGIALMAKGLELKLRKGGSEATPDATRIHQLLRRAMNHASDLAHDLATLDLERDDLPRALRDLAAQTRKLFGISCRLRIRGTAPPLEPTIVGQLSKIAQEAVTNAIKHGRAEQVVVQLAAEPERLVLTVRNDGRPFPDLSGRWSTGMGLRIMRYRASLAGASLDIQGAGESGTVVTCTLPVGGL